MINNDFGKFSKLICHSMPHNLNTSVTVHNVYINCTNIYGLRVQIDW